MTKQTNMIHRLVDLKERAAGAAETAHFVAHQATRAAKEQLKRAIDAWRTFSETKPDVTSVHDLEDRDRQYKWLWKAIDEAEKRVQIARLEEAAKRETMTETRGELRRYETWLERTTELHALEAKRLQVSADDEEIAALRSCSGAAARNGRR